GFTGSGNLKPLGLGVERGQVESKDGESGTPGQSPFQKGPAGELHNCLGMARTGKYGVYGYGRREGGQPALLERRTIPHGFLRRQWRFEVGQGGRFRVADQPLTMRRSQTRRLRSTRCRGCLTCYNGVSEPWTRGPDARPGMPRCGVESVRPRQKGQFPGSGASIRRVAPAGMSWTAIVVATTVPS